MRVLVVSHNVFCKTTSMGKTLMAYFNGWDTEQIAQLYIHSEVPTDDICRNYYRMTDKEIIKSIFTRKSGRVFTEKDIPINTASPTASVSSHVDTGRKTAVIYQKARKRTPLVYFLRNLWWDLGAWDTRKLRSWINDFDPEVIFLASGDYSFIYKIARKIAKYKDIPLVVCCVDDFYLNNQNSGRRGGKYIHRAFMRQVKKTMKKAASIFTICEKMCNDYQALFHKPCYVLHTPASILKPLDAEKTNAISYIGNLGYQRYAQLVELGRALLKVECGNKPPYIDVYSADNNPNFIRDLTLENGIRFHGEISSSEVLEVIGKSMAIIHTESFGEWIKRCIAYSVSTKIADSLASGTSLLAYGPKDIASMDYLLQNNAAYCITGGQELVEGLTDFLSNPERRDEIVANALRLAARNHHPDKNSELVRSVLEQVVRDHNRHDRRKFRGS